MKKNTLILAPVAIVVAVAALLFLLTSATANPSFFSRNYYYLLFFNGAAVIVLAAIVIFQLYRLWQEYRLRIFGSRIRMRLLILFACLALLPGILIYTVSLQFVVRSIDNWFDVRVERALEGGVALGQNALDYLVSQTMERAQKIALKLEGQENVTPTQLNELREQANVSSATLLNTAGQILTTVSKETSLLPALPTPAQLRRARLSRNFSLVETSNQDPNLLLIRILVPVARQRTALVDPHYLQLTQQVPMTFSRHIEAVQEASRDYQQIVLGRSGLKRIYALTLTASLLFALFGALAVAFVFARRFAAPLLALAKGTQAVAKGNYAFQLTGINARDELGILLHSFNEMLQELNETRAQNIDSQNALTASHAYLESVLAHLSTGVLAFDPNRYMRAANHGASVILQDSLAGFESFPLEQWPRHESLRDLLYQRLTGNEKDWEEQIEFTIDSTHETRILRVRGARLPEIGSGGYVVVFDDISGLILAQRRAAWAEVAQRLAHEIKNPLTPIQLSAERLHYKLAPLLNEQGQEVLTYSTQTIVNQVEAMKNLVNAFRDYARLPSPNVAALDLIKLVEEILYLYESTRLKIVTHFAARLPLVMGDPAQIRQIIHNLLQNAEDALADQTHPELAISITQQNDKFALLSFCDNGSGFPPEVLARSFEPYFTTKSRGTGLGLAIVKKIIDEHEGEIQISNAKNGGAQINLTLRLANQEMDQKHHGQYSHR